MRCEVIHISQIEEKLNRLAVGSAFAMELRRANGQTVYRFEVRQTSVGLVVIRSRPNGWLRFVSRQPWRYRILLLHDLDLASLSVDMEE